MLGIQLSNFRFTTTTFCDQLSTFQFSPRPARVTITMTTEINRSSDGLPCTLLYNHYSAFSLRLRYFERILWESNNQASRKTVPDTSVDIYHEEQPVEGRLSQVSLDRQVSNGDLCHDLHQCRWKKLPVLGSFMLTSSPGAQILAITAYNAEPYPSLRPESYAVEIQRLVTEMHKLNLCPLSIRGGLKVAAANVSPVLKAWNHWST